MNLNIFQFYGQLKNLTGYKYNREIMNKIKKFFYFLIFYLFLFLDRGKEKEKRRRETSMCGCLLREPHKTWSATQACALTGNQTSDPLVHRLALNPLSHTSQGSRNFNLLGNNVYSYA